MVLVFFGSVINVIIMQGGDNLDFGFSFHGKDDGDNSGKTIIIVFDDDSSGGSPIFLTLS